MAGRPKRRTPTELLYFSGKKAPDANTELCTMADMPVPVRIAKDKEKKQIWDYICADMESRQCLSATYAITISELIETLALMNKCRKEMDENGLVIDKRDDEGNYLGSVESPYVKILARQQGVLLKLLEKLGMTPRDITYLMKADVTPDKMITGFVTEVRGMQYWSDT